MAKSRARKLADIIVSAGVDIDGNLTFDGGSTSADLTFADNDKANFGDASDLQIYHTGSSSVLRENGPGTFYIQGTDIVMTDSAGAERYADFTFDGASRLYHDNSVKFATTSTGIDVTGTLVSDGLTVDGDASVNRATFSDTASDPALEISGRTDSSNLDFKFTDTDGSVVVDQVHHKSEYYATDGTQVSAKVRTEYADVSGGMNYVISTSSAGVAVRDRLKVGSNGDISFYENTGTTAKLFWDASAELLEVSSTGNGYAFRPSSTSSDYALMHVQAQDGTGLAAIRLDGSSGLRFHTNGTNNTAEKMRINSSGNIGIGTTSPSSMLHLQDSSDLIEIRLEPQGQANYPKLVGASAAGTNDTYFAVDFVTRGEALRVDGETGNLVFNGSANITSNTSDGSDNAQIIIAGGGSASSADSRGASIHLAGNENGNGGLLQLRGGSGSVGGIRLYSAGSERMRITPAGNVGIGTSSPSGKLDVAGNVYLAKYSGTGENQTILAQNDYGQMRAGIRSGIPYIGSITSLDFALYTGNSERVRIDTAGNVGIGTSPSSKLHVSGSGTLEVARFETTTDNTPSIGIYSNSGVRTVLRGSTAESALLSQGSTPLLLGTNNTERMRIDASGQVGIGTSSPQELLHLSATTPVFRLEGGSRSYQQFVSGTDFVIRDVTATANRIYLNSSGNVGIGTSNSYGLTHWQDNSTINLIATNTGADGQADTTVMSLIGQARGYSNNLAKLANIDFKTDPNTWYRGVMTFNVANFDGTDTSRTPLEAMRIDSAGNVGIGTGNVIRAPLQVHNSSTGTGSTNFRISRSVDSSAVNRKFAIILGTDAANLGSTWKMESESSNGYNDNAKLNFIHNSAGTPSTRVTFAHDGNVGIGTATPAAPLHVSSTGHAHIFEGTGGNVSLKLQRSDASGEVDFGDIQFVNNTGIAAKINSRGEGSASGNLTFHTRNTSGSLAEKLRIDSSGQATLRLGGSTTNSSAVISSCTSTSSSGGAGTGNYLELEAMEPNNPNYGAKKLRLGVQGGGYVKMTMPGAAGLFIESPYQTADKIHVGYAGVQLDMNGGGFGGNQNMLIRCANDIMFHPGGSERWRMIAPTGSTPSVFVTNQTTVTNIGGTPPDLNSLELGPGYINLNRDDTVSATQIQFGKNGSVAGSIVTTSSTTYNTTSDRRAKENIVDAQDAGELIDGIRVREFDWKNSGEHQRYGMVAQELLEVAPEVVHQPEDEEQMMGVDYSKLVPMLVKEIQSLRARVAELEGE